MLWARLRRFGHLITWSFSPWRWSTAHCALTVWENGKTVKVACTCGRIWAV